MAEALIRGLLAGGDVRAEQVVASAPRPARRTELTERYGIDVTEDNSAVARGSDIVVLAVKPQILPRVLHQIAGDLNPQAIVISVAAGVSCANIEKSLPAATRVVRAMPNTPALVQSGATAIAAGARATEKDIAEAMFLFDAVGITAVVDESLLDAVTGLSGSGPAYIFLILEALADGGVKVGLPRQIAQRLAAQTVLGSAKLLLQTEQHPGQLKDMVTSPGGTTIAGVHTLEQNGVRAALIDAVEAATSRARSLGKANS